MIKRAQKTFEADPVTYEDEISEAREQINRSNWVFVKQSNHVEMLVGVILDFLRTALDKHTTFESKEQVLALCQEIKSKTGVEPQ